MAFTPTVPHRRGARPASVLIMLVIGLFVFLTAFGMITAGQVMHARRLDAEYGRLQAIYAAESGIYAAFDAHASVADTTLWTSDGNLVRYSGTYDNPLVPTWITGVGTATIRGDTFTARVRAYSIGTRILLWDFGT